METKELWISFLISIYLLASLFVWVPCLHGCERLMRRYTSGRQERMLSQQRGASEQSEVAQAEGIA